MLKRHNGIKVALGRAARLLPRQREPCRAHIFWVINISACNVYAKAAVAPEPRAPARPWCRWVGERQPSASLCAASSGEKRPTQCTRVRKGRGSQRCHCSALVEKLMVLLGGCWGEMLRWEGDMGSPAPRKVLLSQCCSGSDRAVPAGDRHCPRHQHGLDIQCDPLGGSLAG